MQTFWENTLIEFEDGKWKLDFSFGQKSRSPLQIDHTENGIAFNNFVLEKTETGVNYRFQLTNTYSDKTLLIGSGNAARVKLMTDNNEYTYDWRGVVKPNETQQVVFPFPDIKGSPKTLQISGLLFADPDGKPFPGKGSDYVSVSIPLSE